MSDGTPGWYPDPERPGATRYWDGRAWAPSAPDAPQPAWPGAAPRPTNDSLALVSLILSVFGAFLLPLVVSVVLAIVSRRRINRSNGALTGKTLTTIALVISAVWVVLIGGFVALGVAGVFDQVNADDYEGVEREVAEAVDRFEAGSGDEICDELVTAELRARLGGDDCAEQLDLDGPGRRAQIDVTDITVTGDTASATAEEEGDTLTFQYELVDGEWLIADVT